MCRMNIIITSGWPLLLQELICEDDVILTGKKNKKNRKNTSVSLTSESNTEPSDMSDKLSGHNNLTDIQHSGDYDKQEHITDSENIDDSHIPLDDFSLDELDDFDNLDSDESNHAD